MHRISTTATDDDLNEMRTEISGLQRDLSSASSSLQNVSGSLNKLFREMTKFLTPAIREIDINDVLGNLRQIPEVAAMLRMHDSPGFCVGDDSHYRGDYFPHAFDFGQPIVVTGTELIHIVMFEAKNVVHCLTNEGKPKFIKNIQKRCVKLITDDDGYIIRQIYDL